MLDLMLSYPSATAFLATMGFMRAINKPLFALIQKGVDATETKFDNELWGRIKSNKIMQSFLWLLDFTTSIKVPK